MLRSLLATPCLKADPWRDLSVLSSPQVTSTDRVGQTLDVALTSLEVICDGWFICTRGVPPPPPNDSYPVNRISKLKLSPTTVFAFWLAFSEHVSSLTVQRCRSCAIQAGAQSLWKACANVRGLGYGRFSLQTCSRSEYSLACPACCQKLCQHYFLSF